MSVQVHAELVQVLAGNAVVAKTPSQSGFHCLTFAHAFMARAGLPVTLLSGVGGKLGDVLISNPRIGTLAFVRGRSNARKAVELGEQFEEAMQGRGFPCTAARWCAGVFLMAGHLGIRRTPLRLRATGPWSLHHAEPFGPLDSVVCVDTEAELLAAMNASNGCLVASLATDDMDFASRLAEQLRAFKVGINRPRSRGDREEVFGGMGESWKGAFVGGDLLVQAVTYGPDSEDERLFGNLPDYSQFPSR
jgi:acyl-CoA reductase-like NAD-dependent aldehyde dehydrogenase